MNLVLESNIIMKTYIFEMGWGIMFQSVFMEAPDWERFKMGDVISARPATKRECHESGI